MAIIDLRGQMKKTKKIKPYHLLVYSEDGAMKMRRFASEKELGEFVDIFFKLHPDYADEDSDNWIDFAITNVIGDVVSFTDWTEKE